MFTETTLERINADTMPEVDHYCDVARHHTYTGTEITWTRYIEDGHRFDTETVSIKVPEWIEADRFTMDHTQAVCSLRDLIRGGCASGCYMPACEYSTATKTMSDHGSEVNEYVQECFGEIPAMEGEYSHAQYCCHVLCIAVELWASNALDTLDEWD